MHVGNWDSSESPDYWIQNIPAFFQSRVKSLLDVRKDIEAVLRGPHRERSDRNHAVKERMIWTAVSPVDQENTFACLQVLHIRNPEAGAVINASNDHVLFGHEVFRNGS